MMEVKTGINEHKIYLIQSDPINEYKMKDNSVRFRPVC